MLRHKRREQLKKMYILHRILNPMGTMDGIDFLLDKLHNTKSNANFFESTNAKQFSIASIGGLADLCRTSSNRRDDPGRSESEP